MSLIQVQIRLAIFPPNDCGCRGCENHFMYSFCLSTSFKHVMSSSHLYICHVFLYTNKLVPSILDSIFQVRAYFIYLFIWSTSTFVFKPANLSLDLESAEINRNITFSPNFAFGQKVQSNTAYNKQLGQMKVYISPPKTKRKYIFRIYDVKRAKILKLVLFYCW